MRRVLFYAINQIPGTGGVVVAVIAVGPDVDAPVIDIVCAIWCVWVSIELPAPDVISPPAVMVLGVVITPARVINTPLIFTPADDIVILLLFISVKLMPEPSIFTLLPFVSVVLIPSEFITTVLFCVSVTVIQSSFNIIV